MGVEEVLKQAHRPLTPEEIIIRTKDKNRRSVFRELNKLRDFKQIAKIEIKITISTYTVSEPIVLYRWIG